MQVVDGRERGAEHLIDAQQVMQVRASEVGAGVAAAVGVDREHVLAEARVGQANAPGGRVDHAGARVARREHAVEHVDAACDAFDEVDRTPDAHQVACLRLVDVRQGVVEHVAHRAVALADRQAADRDAVEADLLDLLGGALAEIAPESTLNDAEQRLVWPRMCSLRPALPARGAPYRRLRVAAIGAERQALVEHHRDVAAEILLDLHRALGREESALPVDLVGERDAFFGHFFLVEREDLKAA